jgi:hypothetical protein
LCDAPVYITHVRKLKTTGSFYGHDALTKFREIPSDHNFLSGDGLTRGHVYITHVRKLKTTGSFYWHDAHTKFRENPSDHNLLSGDGLTRGHGDIMDIIKYIKSSL